VVNRLAIRLAVLSVLCAFAGLCLGPVAGAQACDAGNQHEFGVSPGCFDMQVTAPPTATNLAPDFTAAGGHPYEVVTTIRFNAPADAEPEAFRPPEPAKDVFIGLPAGLAINSAAPAVCSMTQLTEGEGLEDGTGCAPASQVGTVEVDVDLGGEVGQVPGIPLFNMGSTPGAASQFGFGLLGVSIVTNTELAAGSSSEASLKIQNLTQTLGIVGMGVSLWGVPADPRHTPDRACPHEALPGEFGGPSCAAGVPARGFIRLPTACTGPTITSLRTDSWTHPGNFKSAEAESHLAPGILGDPTDLGGYPVPYPGLDSIQWGAPQGFTDCDQPPFNPSMEIQPTSHSADSPTGLDIGLKFPQTGLDDPEGIAESDLKSASFTFPQGLAINVAVANGLDVCTAAQIDIDAPGPASCPDSSKLGTVEIQSPALGDALRGSIYAAAPAAGATGSALPVYLAAEDEDTVVKLAGRVATDGSSGPLVTALEGVPQIPIASLDLHFFSGQRAPFVTPPTCGAYSSVGSFVPWARSETVTRTSEFSITSGAGGAPCAGKLADLPFKPGFSAGVTNPVAGATTAFTMQLSRSDGQQELSALDLSLPAGLMASLRGVETCSDAGLRAAAFSGHSAAAEVARPSCPPASKIGSLTVAAGAGTEPFYLKTGKLYFAGPYQGSQLSIAAIVPLLAGPLDSQTSVLRMPLQIDPRDGHLSLQVSLQGLGGSGLKLQSLAMNLDRPGFLVNPTHCLPGSIKGRVGGSGGAVADVSAPFQIVDCGALGFAPRLRMQLLGGKAALHHAAHPQLGATVDGLQGGANLRRVDITLPDSEQLDPAHIHEICMNAAFARDKCPKGSRYGSLTVVSPMLEKPLGGSMYMRPSRHKFPDLVATLRGQLNVDMVGRIAFSGGRLRFVFDSLPDLPISKFALTMFGGNRGLLVNNRNLCAAPVRSSASLEAQNGKAVNRSVRAKVRCGG
jgi:hypothetical protein